MYGVRKNNNQHTHTTQHTHTESSDNVLYRVCTKIKNKNFHIHRMCSRHRQDTQDTHTQSSDNVLYRVCTKIKNKNFHIHRMCSRHRQDRQRRIDVLDCYCGVYPQRYWSPLKTHFFPTGKTDQQPKTYSKILFQRHFFFEFLILNLCIIVMCYFSKLMHIQLITKQRTENQDMVKKHTHTKQRTENQAIVKTY